MNSSLRSSKTVSPFGAPVAGKRGQGMTEYVIILVAIAVVCIAIAVQFGGEIKDLFETAEAEVGTVDDNL
ncbi:MAG TPA: hypothetical protein DIU15_09005 [Deltaproteobacteria bacterium]|nr:hypothetical protein [Deltaproteobacteria bacterium]HCP46167.1 hypothetical protein [Deltaproteobacteria bacterium]